MYWCFAIINNKSGEIYFDRRENGEVEFQGHCYVKRTDFRIKGELHALDQETKKFKIVYRNKKYKLIKNS